MKILIIGGGGREHAVALALAKSPAVKKLWAAPGNGGTAAICENVPLGACDMEGVLAFCRENRPDLVVVTPDDPLALGMVDMLEKHGFSAFGPRARAAACSAASAVAAKAVRAGAGYGEALSDDASFRTAPPAHPAERFVKRPKSQGICIKIKIFVFF